MPHERRRANRGQRIIVILLMAVTLLMAGLSCALALQVYRRTDPSLIGTWRMELDLTETARARANAWLQNAKLGERIDAGDVLPKLTVRAELALREDGSWEKTLDADSLARAKAAADKALAASLRELLRLRITDAGRPAVTAAEADRQIAAAIGMTAEEYIAACGPALLPGEAELRARLEGSGFYQIEGPNLRFDGGRAVRFLTDDTLLVLSADDGTEVYARAKR